MIDEDIDSLPTFEEDSDFGAYSDPYDLTPEQLESIGKLRRVVMKTQQCDYTKATIIAYIEWLALTETDDTKH